ncbi:MAG: type III-B CRISPR module-associated protein Cmr3 [Saprospiraceae bacterium]
MKLQLEPLDPLFFRDGRPFTMGEETYAEGVFPPMPSTVRGALRSMWMSQKLDAYDTEKDKQAKASARIAIRYFGLSIGDKPVFHVPLDLFFSGRGKETLAQPMELIKPSFVSSCPVEVSYLFKADTDGKVESVAGHLLDEEGMKKYINGNTPSNIATERLSDFVKKEHKIGIGRNNETHLTEEGLLYRLISNRFEDMNDDSMTIIIDVEGFDTQIDTAPLYSVILLGGERKSVVARSCEFDLPDVPKIQGRYFKIVLLTPALFGTWYPKHLCDEFSGLKLIAASAGKPVLIGGWDILNQCPKPMRRAVPTGSVFLFEAIDEVQANMIARKYHGESICKPLDDLDGLGICFVAQPFDNQKIK